MNDILRDHIGPEPGLSQLALKQWLALRNEAVAGGSHLAPSDPSMGWENDEPVAIDYSPIHGPGIPTILQWLLFRADLKEIAEFVDTLSDNDQSILLWLIENAPSDIDYQEFAEQEGISEAVARKRAERLRAKLRKRFERDKPRKAKVRYRRKSYLAELPSVDRIKRAVIRAWGGAFQGERGAPEMAIISLHTTDGHEGKVEYRGPKALERAPWLASAMGLGGIWHGGRYMPNGRPWFASMKDDRGNPLPSVIPTMAFQRVVQLGKWEYPRIAPTDKAGLRTWTVAGQPFARVRIDDRHTESDRAALLDAALFYRMLLVAFGFEALGKLPFHKGLALVIEALRKDEGREDLPALMDKPIMLAVDWGIEAEAWGVVIYDGKGKSNVLSAAQFLKMREAL